jgi:D-serine deaminase-like pyridoxal phosphate-dependent protein
LPATVQRAAAAAAAAAAHFHLQPGSDFKTAGHAGVYAYIDVELVQLLLAALHQGASD